MYQLAGSLFKEYFQEIIFHKVQEHKEPVPFAVYLACVHFVTLPC